MYFRHIRVLGIALLFLLTFNFSSFATDKVKTTTKEYWPDGKIRVSKEHTQSGDLKDTIYYREDGSMEKYIKYDEDGNKIEESNYGHNGKLRETGDGWAAMKWEYIDGQLARETYYSSDGKVKEQKDYSEGGDLVGKTYVGNDIDPAEEYNPPLTLSGRENTYYDEYGRKEGSTVAVKDDWPWWHYRRWYPDRD